MQQASQARQQPTISDYCHCHCHHHCPRPCSWPRQLATTKGATASAIAAGVLVGKAVRIGFVRRRKTHSKHPSKIEDWHAEAFAHHKKKLSEEARSFDSLWSFMPRPFAFFTVTINIAITGNYEDHDKGYYRDLRSDEIRGSPEAIDSRFHSQPYQYFPFPHGG